MVEDIRLDIFDGNYPEDKVTVYINPDDLDLSFIDLLRGIREQYDALEEKDPVEKSVLERGLRYSDLKIGVQGKNNLYDTFEKEANVRDSIQDFLYNKEEDHLGVDIIIKGHNLGGLEYKLR